MAICARVALLSSLLSLGAWLPSQSANGAVQGFDGQPTAGVVVSALDHNRIVLREVLTKADGRFAIAVDVPIHSLRVQNEGVRLEVPCENGGADGLAITFEGVAHFTVRGHVLDPGGEPAAGVDVLCRDVAGQSLVATTTDAQGAFTLRTNRTVHQVLVDPLGWQHEVNGLFDASQDFALDLRQARSQFVCLRGRTIGEGGQGERGMRIHALADARRVASTVSGVDGAFVLWSKHSVTHVMAFDGVPRIARLGPWAADAECDLDEREHGFMLVSGRVVDAAGQGSQGAAVFGVAAKVRPARPTIPDGATTRDGEFCVRVPRYQTHLWFFQESGNRQAFAEIVAGKRVTATLGQ